MPEEKKAETVNTVTNAVTDGLKNNFTMDNILNIKNLFKKETPVENNPITNNIQGTVTSSLMEKIGLSPQVAALLSSTVVPLVLKSLSGKVNDPNEKGFNIESLIGMFSGSGNSGNLMGSLGKLFG
ncbi:MAG: hypothetical protein LUH22_18215 [Bacteroides sp.]|nr:hypothetical protein [Bacteroides sp.]